MKVLLYPVFWNNRKDFINGYPGNRTNLMVSLRLAKENNPRGLAQKVMYTKGLDPSINVMLKKMERWAVNKGLGMSALLTTGLLFAFNL